MADNIDQCLRNFIRHVDELRAEDDPAGSGFHREFRILRELQIQNKNEEKFSLEDGKKDENVKKNRYKDILPRDDRRVKLTPVRGEEGSDYINATFIKDVDGCNGYIAAQGPMPQTVSDFWRMLWEYNTEIVFMACRTSEGGKPKCEKYWADKGKSITFGNITVFTETEEEVQKHFVRRTLKATQGGRVHRLTQFQYEGWPDHDTPSSPDTLRCMIQFVRDHRKRPDIPMVIHCSAGCGRTGTICAIDFAWTLLDQGKIDSGFSLFEIIKSLREQRLSMVQTPDQYEYIHMVMKSLCEEWLELGRKCDYENVFIDNTASVFQGEEYCSVDFQGDTVSVNDGNLYGNVDSLATEKKKPALAPRPSSLKSEGTGRQSDLEIVSLKSKTGDGKGPRPSSSSAAQPAPISAVGEDVAGVYVTVASKAGASQQMSPTSPPPSLPDKKNPLNSMSRLEPHKTVITVGYGGNMTNVLKTGSTAARKSAEPKPAAASLFADPGSTSHCPYPAASVSSQQSPSMSNSGGVNIYSAVEKKTTTESLKEPPVGTLITLADHEDAAPAVPERLYRADEVENASSGRPKHNYDNMVPAPRGVAQSKEATKSGPEVVSVKGPAQTAQSSTTVKQFVPSGLVPITQKQGSRRLAPSASRPVTHQQVLMMPASGVKGPQGRLIFAPERLPRVKGPRPVPSSFSKGQLKTKQVYL